VITTSRRLLMTNLEVYVCMHVRARAHVRVGACVCIYKMKGKQKLSAVVSLKLLQEHHQSRHWSIETIT
jgi:hypothetical protein